MSCLLYTSFNNDYNRGAFDCILKAMADINTTSYPGYGEDEWCDKAEQIIKGLSLIHILPLLKLLYIKREKMNLIRI